MCTKNKKKEHYILSVNVLKTLTQKTNPSKQNCKLSISMSGNIFFKISCVSNGFDWIFSNILTLIVPFDTKKRFNLPIPL